MGYIISMKQKHTISELDRWRRFAISLKSYLSAAEIWRNRHILCVRLPFDLTLTGTQTYAALANQQPVYVRHLRLSFKCFCITTSPDGNTSLYINEKPQMTHMFDLQYIRFGVKDDMVEKHVVTRKRSAARICTLFTKVVRKGTSGSRPASESVPLYISVNSECASSWHRQTCQTVLKVYQPFRRYVRRGCDWLRSGFIWTGFVWRFPETLYEASVIYICLSVSFGSHFNETGRVLDSQSSNSCLKFQDRWILWHV